MGELIIFLIGAVLSGLLALAKITVWASLAWWVVLIPIGIALLILLGESIFD